jgi:cytochrome c peroxidase
MTLLIRFTLNRFRFAVVLLIVGCSGASPPLHHFNLKSTLVEKEDSDEKDSPVKLVGERLFRETRFSEYFYRNGKGDWNHPPVKGDTVVESLDTIHGPIDHPYRGQAMACASCHFVDQVTDTPGGGSRAYTDFSRRSFIPLRLEPQNDGQKTTPRNAPNMVGSTQSPDFFLHADGEFATPADLVRATFTGRNMGWYFGEENEAIHNIAQVVRHDTGEYPTETDLGGLSYPKLLAGDPSIPSRFSIPIEYRMDITGKTDQEIFDGVVHLIVGYMNTLDFARNDHGLYKGSPFDVFLRKNHLPRAPVADETPLAYTRRLVSAIEQQNNLKFVSTSDRQFKLHKQEFVFSSQELEGFKIFAGRGQCVRCHAAPDFTDHLFHNTGASQIEYDGIHGSGAFMKMKIPDLATRNRQAQLFLPASSRIPQSLALMKSPADPRDARRTDLGVWNVFANPDMPHPQARLRLAICKALALSCTGLTDDALLARTVAMVKTPTLRDLGQTEPYLHTGQMDTIEDTLHFYIQVVALAKAHQLRSGDPALTDVNINESDIPALSSFLRSLNEDYD